LSKALKNKINVEGEASQREIVKLRSEVSGLRFDCEEKEKSFKILEKEFIESRTKVQAISEELSKLKETMGKQVSELEASGAEKDKCIASLEAELNQAKEEYEAETNKIRQAFAEVAVDLNAAQVKIGDLNDEVNHVRQLKKNYQILAANCYTLDNRCYNELTKAFSSIGAKSRKKNFVDGDLEGMIRWILSETRAYKSVLS
jgi:chromosome segregation ATPase